MRLLRPLWCCLLGAALLFAGDAAGPTKKGDPAPPSAIPPQPTIIESDTAEMVSTDKESTFTFLGNVTVTGTNLRLTCDQIVVVANRSGDPNAIIGKQESFKAFVATGNVRIEQDDRIATCGRAEIFPGEDKIVLTQPDPQLPDPRVVFVTKNKKPGETDESALEGPVMVLHRGERRAEILRNERTRPTITLPSLKDLGYDKVPEKNKKAATAEDSGPKVELPKTETPK